MSEVMNNSIFGTKERAQIVAKDILAAFELAAHPSFIYTPSRQLQAAMSDHEIATFIVHLNKQDVININERRMFLGGHIDPLPHYEIHVNVQTLTLAAHPELLNNTIQIAGYKPAHKSKPTLGAVDIYRQLKAQNYSDRTGKLTVSPTVDIAIAVNGKVKRKNGKRYEQCHLMSCLFKSVNSLNDGVTFSRFLGVKYDKNNTKHAKKIRNTIDEINKKVSEVTNAKKLILIQKEKIFIDKSYLLE